MPKIAFLGLGAMGSRMAHRLLDAGFPVTVYNRSLGARDPLVTAGARAADSPREAASGADVVIAMLTDDEASRSVWLDVETGAVGGLEPGALAIETSTLGSAWARELGTAVAEQGGRFLDAPVAGSRPQADAGQLIFLVGGPAETLDSARPVLDPMASAIHHVGEVGQGMAMKLAVNAYFGVQVAALSEVLGLTSGAGIALDRAVKIFRALPITSPALSGVGAQIEAAAFDPLFPIHLVSKDLSYAVSEAEAMGGSPSVAADGPAPITAAAGALYDEARQRGFGDQNISAVARLFV